LDAKSALTCRLTSLHGLKPMQAGEIIVKLRSIAMKKGKASWTAEVTAIFRATESIRPIQVRLLRDKYATKFLRPSLQIILKFRCLALSLLWLMIDRRFPGASITAVTRIRFVDDCLKNGINDGVEQIVILGAGYDSRAYRFGELQNKMVFEVDHPNTQKLKINKILHIFNKLPENVFYVPVDFEKDNFVLKLVEAGYRKDKKTLFIWEAVSKYLTQNAVNELLSAVSSNSCKGSSIVFDYLFQSMVDRSSGSKFAKKVLDFQDKKGEPFIFGLPKTNPENFIMKKGFSSVKNFTSTKIKNMYFSDNSRAKNLHPFWGIIHATV
jgi:methyltransferase (TIGR00027 family)